MPLDYDMKPTDPLRLPHLVGNVDQRFLISYPVPPASMAPLVPPGGELVLFGGMAWVSACAVRLSALRPSSLPRALGMDVEYLIFRTVANLPFPDGRARRSVLMLESNLSSRRAALLSRRITGIGSRARPLRLEEGEKAWHVTMREWDGTPLFSAEVHRDGVSRDLPPGSAFPNPAAAAEFILNMSFGGEWLPKRDSIRLLAETHDPCGLEFGRATTRMNALVERLAGRPVEADHVLVMSNVPHEFALRGVLSPTSAAR